MQAQQLMLEAVVKNVLGKGKDRYAVAKLTSSSPKPASLRNDTFITFSLQVWKDEHEPWKGQIVALHDVRMFEKGWRALSAEPILA